MAYLTIARIAGNPEELLRSYAQTSESMTGVGRDHALLLHAAAPTDDGLLMLNLWRDPADAQAAAADPRRIAALLASGLEADQVRKEHLQVTNLVVFDPLRAEC